MKWEPLKIIKKIIDIWHHCNVTSEISLFVKVIIKMFFFIQLLKISCDDYTIANLWIFYKDDDDPKVLNDWLDVYDWSIDALDNDCDSWYNSFRSDLRLDSDESKLVDIEIILNFYTNGVILNFLTLWLNLNSLRVYWSTADKRLIDFYFMGVIFTYKVLRYTREFWILWFFGCKQKSSLSRIK